jgi:hypothetical protein
MTRARRQASRTLLNRIADQQHAAQFQTQFGGETVTQRKEPQAW